MEGIKYKLCSLCKEYVNVDELGMHLSTHSNVTLSMYDVFGSEKYVCCNKCFKTFSVREILPHLKTMHPFGSSNWESARASTPVKPKRPRIVYDVGTDDISLLDALEHDVKTDVKVEEKQKVTSQQLYDALYPLCCALKCVYWA